MGFRIPLEMQIYKIPPEKICELRNFFDWGKFGEEKNKEKNIESAELIQEERGDLSE